MSTDIQQILERLSLIESKVTPATVKKGLNQQQKDVPQMPALFKPKSISVLSAPDNPQHPAKKFFVGGESKEVTQEDLISQVKKGLNDYLKNIEDEIKDRGDLQKKDIKLHGDKLGAAVKTIKSHDGHEFKIHGSEDDGFRISKEGRVLPTKFKNFDHAVMACEMYCNYRKESLQPTFVTREATPSGTAPMVPTMGIGAAQVAPIAPVAPVSEAPDYIEEA